MGLLNRPQAKRVRKGIILFLTVLFAGPVQAQVQDQNLKAEMESHFGIMNQDRALLFGQSTEFLRPNELEPMKARPFLEASTAGALISVGTERGFLTAALVNNVTHLFLVDRSFAVTVYNRINAALLKLSRDQDRLHYLSLRKAKNHSVWIQALRESNEQFNETELALLRNPEAFNFWRETSQKRRLYLAMGGQHRLTEKSGYGRFENVNYLQYDNQFSPLQKLAKKNRIIALNFSLAQEKPLREFTEFLKSARIKINVLDISNAWQPGYIPPKYLANTLRVFAGVSHRSSLLLTTKQRESGSPAMVIEWDYMDFNLQEIAQEEEGKLLDVIERRFKSSCRAKFSP